MQPSLNSKSLVFWDENNHHNEVIIDHIPDTCPICDRGIKPIFITAYGFKKGYSYREQFLVQTVFRCPRNECQGLFLTIYKGIEQAGSRGTSEFVFMRATGILQPDIADQSFDEEINKISPRFVKVYNQAKKAEEGSLDEISGSGYRKSLEILIKDYLITTKPELKEDVENHFLGYIIANFIDNDKIKNMAGLAKEVGNDETHYIKKIEELTIEDLKKLIKLTTHWIVTELLTEEYSEVYQKLMSQEKNQ